MRWYLDGLEDDGDIPESAQLRLAQMKAQHQKIENLLATAATTRPPGR